MVFGKRHGTRLHPGVENFRRAAHHSAARIARERYLIYIRPVQVGFAGIVARNIFYAKLHRRAGCMKIISGTPFSTRRPLFRSTQAPLAKASRSCLHGSRSRYSCRDVCLPSPAKNPSTRARTSLNDSLSASTRVAQNALPVSGSAFAYSVPAFRKASRNLSREALVIMDRLSPTLRQ